jgi:hypothetical protein
MWLATQIFVQGHWLLQPLSPNPVSPIVKASKPTAKR